MTAKTFTASVRRLGAGTALLALALGSAAGAAAPAFPEAPSYVLLAQAGTAETDTAPAGEPAVDAAEPGSSGRDLAAPPETRDGSALGEVPALDLTEEDRADLARASAYLNGIRTLKGEFTQFSDSGGMAEGEVWLKKPGRMRFEYRPPVQMTFVSDGTWIAVDDREFEVVNRYPLDSTPLQLLLKEEVDLAEDAKIVGIERLPGQLRITAREDDGFAQGELTMIFADPGFELRQWIVEDAQGVRTTVALRNVQEGIEVSNRLFVIEDYEDEW